MRPESNVDDVDAFSRNVISSDEKQGATALLSGSFRLLSVPVLPYSRHFKHDQNMYALFLLQFLAVHAQEVAVGNVVANGLDDGTWQYLRLA